MLVSRQKNGDIFTIVYILQDGQELFFTLELKNNKIKLVKTNANQIRVILPPVAPSSPGADIPETQLNEEKYQKDPGFRRVDQILRKSEGFVEGS